MADVDIEVNSSDLKAAIALLNEYGMSFTGMVNKVQTESNRLARASKATTAEITKAWNNAEEAIDNQKLKKVADEEARILKLREQNWKQFFQDYGKNPSASSAGAPRSAADSALLQNEKALADAMEETARAAKEKEREIVTLTAKYNPLLAAEQAYVRMQNEINRSLQLGVINANQQTAALDQLKKEYDALGAGVYLAGSRFNQFGEMAGISGKAAGRFGMYAQQAGYQVGDFAVQLQSGTNAGVAFSQQAAQLAGLIPGLAGALTTFAAIGLGLVIQSLTRGKKEAKDTYMELSKFEELESIFKSVSSSFETSMVQSLTRVRQEYGEFIADFAKFSLNAEIDKLKANLGTVMDEATANNTNAQGSWFGRISQSMMQTSAGNAGGIAAAQAEAERYNDMLEQVKAAQEQLFDGSINSKSELVTAYQNVYETMKGIPGITQEILDRFVQVGGESGIAAEQIKGMSDSWVNVNKSAAEAFDLYRSTNTELRQSNDLSAVRLRYGAESIQYLNAEKQQQLEIFRTEMERSGMASTLVDKLVQQYEAQIDYEQAAQRFKLVVEQLILDLSTMSGIDISGVFTRAQGAAETLLGTVKSLYAGMVAFTAEQNIRIQQSVRSNPLDPLGAFGGGQSAAFAVQVGAGGVVRSPVMPDWEEPDKPRKGRGGGRTKKTDAEKEIEKANEKLKEFFQQYNLNIKQQERLLGVQGEQREELEKVIEIENRLGEARTMVSQAQIEAMAREELALERKLERERAIYDIGYQNVENLLMTVVNGTASIEDAFKAMLANIISEVYKKFVAEGAADIAGNAVLSLFSANGNAFGVGGVKMFAKGGVVGSPTLFGYGGGKTGMMGEAGPEAIMPLKRNSQGQLGVQVSGGGTAPIHVTNVFQMSANGDAAVKAIIQGEMPKIKEATKMAVIDANRRSQKGFR